MKHYIQAVLGENPFIPYDYYYDVVTWSYPLQRGLAGSGFLTQQLSPGVADDGDQHGTDYGTVAERQRRPCTRSTRTRRAGSALAIDLLDKGVNVYRGVQPFTSGGKRFYTGAALVDGASLAGSELGLTGLTTLAAKRDTPVTGLPGYPVQRRQLSVPKIGLYTNLADDSVESAVPRGPERQRHHASLRADQRRLGVLRGAARPRRQARAARSSRIVPVTSDDLEADKLVHGAFHRVHQPGLGDRHDHRHPAGAHAHRHGAAEVHQQRRQLRRHRRQRGERRPFGRGDHARHRRLGGLQRACNTPGSTFDATFDTSNPVAWGFDLGGWIYRNATSNPVFDPTKLGRRHGGRQVRRHPGREVRLRDQRVQARRPSGGRRLAVRHRSRRSDRVQPVLSLLEGAGRAARAQRGAVPEGRGAAAEPGDAGVRCSRPRSRPRSSARRGRGAEGHDQRSRAA